MNNINHFIISNNIFIYYLTTLTISLILLLLYVYQIRSTKKHQSQINTLWDTVNKLIDHPLLILDQSFNVIYINEKMQPYIQAEVGKSLKRKARQYLLNWEGKEQTLNTLIEIYQKKALKNSFLFKKATIYASERNQNINIRISHIEHNSKYSYIGIAIFDISDKLEVLKRHYTNASTGLPNHNRAIADIGLLANQIASNKKFAIAILALDNFTEVITTIGYIKSLDIITQLSRLLDTLTEEHGFSAYHMEGHQFLLLLPDQHNAKESLLLIEHHKIDIENQLNTHNDIHHFSISAGISMYPENSQDTLIENAYKGLALSQKMGIGYVNKSKENKSNEVLNDTPTIGELKAALKNNEFTLYYQPIYNIKRGSITAAEALIRWIHPTKGVLSPYHFLPIIENTSFMVELSEFVITKAVEQLAIWKHLHFKSIQVSINLSAREFESGNFYHFIDHALEEYHVDSSQLKVEITENIAMNNEDYTLAQFTALRKRGIEISLDDFGTGYSSFSMLELSHINTLKIDKSFIMDIRENTDHYNIVKAMIAMTHTLNIEVIAEGVETQKAIDILKELGCDYLQGYHIAKPSAVFEFQQLIRKEEKSIQDQNTIQL